MATVAVGASFFVIHMINTLSPGFGEGGVGGMVIGAAMIIWGKRLQSQQKGKEALR